MKTRLLSLLIVILPFMANAQWSNYTENYDTWANWQGSSPAAFGPQSYINGGAPENDVFSSNSARVMFNAGCQSAPYHLRLNQSIVPVNFRYETKATINSFQFYMNRQLLAEDPTIIMRYSTNSGDSWTEIETLNASWFNGNTYKLYSYTFPAPVYPEFGKSLIIELNKTYGTYINIDDFTCSYTPACIWAGNDDNGWQKESNWSGGIPWEYSNVTIPAGVANFPTISEASECFNLYILSGASMINTSPLTIHGQAYVYRNISGTGEYHFISTPVVNPNLDDIFPAGQFDNIWLRRYDEPTGNWVNMYIPSTMNPGSGYSFFMNEASTTVTFAGALNSNNITPVLSYAGNTGDADWDNWNLLGNPYTSALDWDLGSWNKTGLNGSVYVWDGASGNYVSWNGSAGSLTNGLIPAQQGFFVKVENEAAPSITIPLDARAHSVDGFLKNQANPSLELMVQNSVNSYSDKTYIEINPEASNDFDTRCDAYKLDGNTDAPGLYTGASGKNLSINAINQINNNLTIPLYLKPGVDAGFTITARGIEQFAGNTNIMLQDLLTGITKDLRSENSYSFQASPGDDAHRFNLVFGTLGIDDGSQLNAGIYSNRKNIFIQVENNFTGQVSVTNVTGQTVIKSDLTDGGLQTIVTDLPSGIYLVTVADQNSRTTRKVFIQ
ncbi:MAG: CHU large protein [Bacteroidetes bacterium]|nr:MAG: CHU large protein [Bacteroidota bacterium]